MNVLYALYVITLFMPVVLGYGSGPPVSEDGLCTDMIPYGHKNGSDSSAEGPAPYTITTSADEYTAGGTLTVTITADSGTMFRGFFMQARRADTGVDQTVPIGTFTMVPSDAQQLTCNNVEKSAWGHNSKDNKTSVQATWTAPAQDEGDLVFKTTIVLGVPDSSYFYPDVKSMSLSFAASPTNEPKPTSGGSCKTMSASVVILAVMASLLTPNRE